jgi:hypothetical protein
VHRTPAGVCIFFRFSKNAPLRGAAHHAFLHTTLSDKSALFTFNHDNSTTMPRNTTLEYKQRVTKAVEAYRSGRFPSIHAAALEFDVVRRTVLN